MILVIANHDLDHRHRHWIRTDNLPENFQKVLSSATVIFTSESRNIEIDLSLEIGDRALCAEFLPGEVKIIEISC